MKLHYEVDGNDFSVAGEASSNVKQVLKKLGVPPERVRKFAIALYEAEINMVIHADGGEIDVEITPDYMEAVLSDRGKGIPDIELAMQEGFSTATDEIRSLGFGAGMGLPNMKKYTDDMRITSEVGKGTQVTMRVNVK